MVISGQKSASWLICKKVTAKPHDRPYVSRFILPPEKECCIRQSEQVPRDLISLVYQLLSFYFLSFFSLPSTTRANMVCYVDQLYRQTLYHHGGDLMHISECYHTSS